MKPSFERQLRTYDDITKDQRDLEREGRSDERLRHVLDWTVERAAKATNTNIETQRDIVRLQRVKRDIMERLRARLRRIDADEGEPDGGRPVKMEAGGLVATDRDGKRFPVSTGELLTDGDWGIRYDLDPASVPKHLRKRYAVAEAKRELQTYLDTQILLQESASGWTHEFKRDTYARILDEREAETAMERSGLVAERMVKNLLKKASIDFGLDFVIHDVDVYQDVEQKVDFIIRRRDADRGVKVEEERRVGIQFTINKTQRAQEKKTKQIERAKRELTRGDRIQDIVLVTMPMDDIRDMLHAWKRHRNPGGPDAAWDVETKQRILRGIFSKLIPDEDIERYCEALQAPSTENPFAPSPSRQRRDATSEYTQPQ
ncbi:hypothetical protein L0Y59_00955 [Candidatus Uhrbacteria bacterium]|nr:hypothetical protein [Candidatus Uhrbacteria bacterium]